MEALFNHIDQIWNQIFGIEKERVTKLLRPFSKWIGDLKSYCVVLFKRKHVFGQTRNHNFNQANQLNVRIFLIGKEVNDVCDTLLETGVREKL